MTNIDFEEIAKKRVANMIKYGVEWERSKLKRYGWNLKEISQIIKKEREIIKKCCEKQQNELTK